MGRFAGCNARYSAEFMENEINISNPILEHSYVPPMDRKELMEMILIGASVNPALADILMTGY